ncbi:Tat pathway signal protein [Streptomyces chumphonensis]|uniref:Tat pathway signal protein n=2 Tax=Streptomyces chumphonensis TaxID=1214925 RepID=A0A927F2J5_9ACTN|nr:Tat pathway signal protein [Streptomyces chumphonensis]
MALTPGRNSKLESHLAEAGWTHAQLAGAVVRVARESGVAHLLGIGRSHVSHWVRGTKPSGRAPQVLSEAFSRRLGRSVTPSDLGLADAGDLPPYASLWDADTLTALAGLGRADLDVDRRDLLGKATYSVAGLAVPGSAWWRQQERTSRPSTDRGSRRIGRGELDAVHDMIALFQRVDQRRGGGHARSAVAQYLMADVASYLRCSYADEGVRRGMLAGAGELAYLAGWMAFDSGEHGTAQRYLLLGVKLAAEAADAPLAGHILRALAHQALDLGHPGQALGLAQASVEGDRYARAAPRERALLEVVHARTCVATGDGAAASAALLRAENELAAAGEDDDEPARVFFFGEASLAHETACALRDLGDLKGAQDEFRRSVRTRKAATFTRTHAVTLGYLGEVQARKGDVEEACATWHRALDAMEGVRSGRTRQVVVNLRRTLSPYRSRRIDTALELDARAAVHLMGTH